MEIPKSLHSIDGPTYLPLFTGLFPSFLALLLLSNMGKPVFPGPMSSSWLFHFTETPVTLCCSYNLHTHPHPPSPVAA